ncbi:MAG: hypothetical protein IMY85_01995 [Chloroflexi bacterium]|jgi:hypothetical protein|nr:hypothetical protein [Chloroflexota bacterium]
MKNKKFFLILVSLLLLTLVFSTSAVSANTPKTYFTGVETIGPPSGGTMKVVDGKVLLRGVIQPGFDDTTDPRTTGVVTIVANAVWTPPALTGPMWGTFRIETIYGVWNGRWQGQRTLEGGDIISTIQGTAHGSGELDGLIGKWKYRGVNVGTESFEFGISGYILEPPGE